MSKDFREDIPEIIAKKYVHRGFFDLRIDTIRSPDQQTQDYTTLCTKTRAAAVLGQDTEGRYILIREYRYPVGKWVYSLPGGRIEELEKSWEGARREFLEETGYRAPQLQPLFLHYPMPSVCDQVVEVFYSAQCTAVTHPSCDLLERIVPVCLREEELHSLFKQEGIAMDSLLCSALFYLRVSGKSC
ncbi:MAG: NUDIX hydrolase [Chlamydiota bacterium]